MAHLSLYRKYRPFVFSDVAGQDTIIKILRNQIVLDHIGHAYLFSGIRGTGKTSIAKIFARSVNCEHPVNGEACGECETCQRLKDDNGLNIIEIDAASNRGVDEIRNLRESIKYPPTFGKYKVYIIDEVHMLTKEAFNALLKTLEEPPPHAIFLLATTEAHRLPATILSRCQKFNIRPISDEAIEKRLKYVIDNEGILIEEQGLKEIARRGDHSMRDALSLLDQCADLSLPGETISHTDIEDFLGIAPKEQLRNLAGLIAEKNAPDLLKAVNSYRVQGREDSVLLEDLTHFFQDLLYYKITGIEDQNFDVSFIELKEMFSEEEIHRIIDLLLKAYSRLRFNSLSQIVTDTTLMSIVSDPEPVQTVREVVRQPVYKPENKFKPPSIPKQAPVAPQEQQPQESKNIEEESEPVKEDIPVAPAPEPMASKTTETSKANNHIDFSNLRENLVELAQERGEGLIKQLIENSELKINKNGLFILLDEKHRFMFDTIDFSRRLSAIVREALGTDIRVFPKIKQEYEAYLRQRQEKQTPFKEEVDIETEVRSALDGLEFNYRKVAD